MPRTPAPRLARDLPPGSPGSLVDPRQAPTGSSAPPDPRQAPITAPRRSSESDLLASAPRHTNNRDPIATQTTRLATDPFFARLRSFDVECPACGALAIVDATVQVPWWDPRTQTFSCLNCNNTVVLGILAWSRARAFATGAAGRGAEGPRSPADTIPSVRQAGRLRQLLSGAWAKQRLPADPAGRPRVNRILTVPCSCRPEALSSGTVHVDPRCPMHGETPATPAESADQQRHDPADMVNLPSFLARSEARQHRTREMRRRHQAELAQATDPTTPLADFADQTFVPSSTAFRRK